MAWARPISGANLPGATRHDTTGDPPRAERTAHLANQPRAERPAHLADLPSFLCPPSPVLCPPTPSSRAFCAFWKPTLGFISPRITRIIRDKRAERRPLAAEPLMPDAGQPDPALLRSR